MNDLKRTDIEGIDTHLKNYKLLVRFLKDERKYAQFMDIFFYKKNRSIYDLFETINRTNLDAVLTNLSRYEYSSIDALWSSIFTYVPFFCRWYKEDLDDNMMCHISSKWVEKLREDISKRKENV